MKSYEFPMCEAKLYCSRPKKPLASLFGAKVISLKSECQIRGVGKEALVCEMYNKNKDTVLYCCLLLVAITIRHSTPQLSTTRGNNNKTQHSTAVYYTWQ